MIAGREEVSKLSGVRDDDDLGWKEKAGMDGPPALLVLDVHALVAAYPVSLSVWCV